MATLAVNVPLPKIFTTGPSSGGPPTAALDYYTVNTIATLPGSSGGGGGGSVGGGGGNLPPPNPMQILCQESTYAYQHFSSCDPVRYMQSPDMPSPRRPTAHAAAALSGPLTFNAPDVYLGGLLIQDVTITYDPTQDTGCGGLWAGGGKMQLGDYGLDARQPSYGFDVCGDGQLLGGGAALMGDVPIISGLLDMTELGASLKGYPIKLTGSSMLSVGGGIVTIPGCFMAVFPDAADPYNYNSADLSGSGCNPPSQLQATGPITSFAAGIAGTAQLNVPVIGNVSLGNGYGFYIYPSYFEFGGTFQLSIPLADVKGTVGGALDVSSHQYDLNGSLAACINWPSPIPSSCVTFQGVVSSAGLGACGSINVFGANLGVYFYEQWGGGPNVGVGSCDLGPVQVVVKPSTARAAPTGAGPTTITIPNGTPVTSITVTGRRHPPLVQITGPGGASASSTTTDQAAGSAQIAIIPLQSVDETVIALAHPAAGSWTISPLSGSAPITGISYRDGLAAPKVTASVVAGKHRAYALKYEILERAGQSVTFAERAPHVFQVLGTVRHATGLLKFTPAISPVRKREIVALVSLSKLPDHNLVVAGYTAPRDPRDPRAGTPGHLKLNHVKGGLTVSWKAGANAGAYLLAVTLADGRHLLFHSGSGNGKVTIAHVRGNVGAQATVVGIGPDGALGSAATGKLGAAGVPAIVTGIKTAAGKNGVIVRWKRVKGAVEYLVHVVVSGAGEGIYYATSTKPRLFPSRALRAIRHGTSATISVRAVSAGGFVGPRGLLRYAPQ